MKKGHRPGTRQNKRSHANIYSKFCKDHGLNEYPADEWQFVRYACFTADHVTSAGTVNNYVNGVRSLQRLAGYDTPPASSPNLKLAMQGIKSDLAQPVRQAVPLNREVLIDIAKLVKWEDHFDMCCYLAILTGFYLFLRCSNLVPTSDVQFNPKEQLTRGHVAIDMQDLEIGMFDVEWSKTIQYRERELWLAVSPASREDICPLATMKKYFHLVPAQDSDPCFCYKGQGGKLKALTYKQLSEKLKE